MCMQSQGDDSFACQEALEISFGVNGPTRNKPERGLHRGSEQKYLICILNEMENEDHCSLPRRIPATQLSISYQFLTHSHHHLTLSAIIDI